LILIITIIFLLNYSSSFLCFVVWQKLKIIQQTNKEGQGGDLNRLMAENFHGLRRNREEDEEHESRSGGSDNIDGVSGDDADNPPRKKRYHRHTPQQIQELESYIS
jgi:homeobox-leucine zipper protein